MGAKTLIELTQELFPGFHAIAVEWAKREQLAGGLPPAIALNLSAPDLQAVARFMSAVLGIQLTVLTGCVDIGGIARRIGAEEARDIVARGAWVLLALGAWLAQQGRITYAAPPPPAGAGDPTSDGGKEKTP